MEDSVQKKSWFSRNWPWVVPVGGCLTLIFVFIFFIGAAIFGVSKAFTGSTPYQDGLTKAQEDQYIIEALGEPIETDGIMQGSIKFENSQGSANISIPIKGPKGTARIFIVGSKNNDQWAYSKMHVVIEETNEQVDLLWDKDSDNNQKENSL